MSTLYVSISCLDLDDELIHTIRSAKDNATNPKNIHFGIAIIGNIKFYEFIIERIKFFRYENISCHYYPLEGNLGVGLGRSLAQSMYDGQDYFLQVDAHTFFDVGWDVFIKEKFDVISKSVNNQKTVVSGYPGRYGYFDEFGNEIFWSRDNFNYPRYLKGEFKIKGKDIPAWGDCPPVYISTELDGIVEKYGFAPITKISAAFILANRYFVEDNCLEPGSIFWEEEVCQSVNLIDRGFTMVYGGKRMPIHHLYADDIIKKKGNRSIILNFVNSDDFWNRMSKSYNDFLDNPLNAKKISFYESYADINLRYGPTKQGAFAKNFANLSYIPYR
jgi:hypothetical protein